MDTQSLWLASLPWDKVRLINESLCKQQSTVCEMTRNHDAVRQLWEKAVAQRMSLEQVLELCRRCYEMAPFTFNNGNTFASVGKSLLDPWLQTLAPLEAQILRNTVGHYIAGMINRKELVKVLRHFETRWTTYAAARQNVPNLPLTGVAPQQHLA